MKKVLIVYHSQEKGNTRIMAELVASGCREITGIDVVAVNVNERRVDMDTAEAADAYALGSPDYFSYPAGNVKQFVDDILLAAWQERRTTGKPCICFVTHGGGGAALPALEKLVKAAKLDQVLPGLSCRGAPQSEDDVRRCIALGREFARKVAAL
ncbi:MAG: FprA family A-type flavoprotein [Kiritimatiellaeota bacterium]|nr:FprA family A-type flavoprotein [Kiritimatiellota bacterium]